MEEKYLPGLEPTDPARITDLAQQFATGGWRGPPIVVVQDGRTSMRWIVSDPHRHAAARQAGIEPQFVRIQDVFENEGKDYWAALDEERNRVGVGEPPILDRQAALAKVEARLQPGTNYWWDMIIDGHLSRETKTKFWSEQGDGTVPLGYSSGRPAPGPRLA